MSSNSITLSRFDNQARGIAAYACDFCQGKFGDPPAVVIERLEQFHLDSVACGVSALAWRTNAPTVLRREALQYGCSATEGVPVFASARPVQPEKAVVANCAAVREWDANGTNFGYNPARQATRGEFGHNDFYPAAVAGAQLAGADGRTLIRAMLCLDEIRGRLAEVFALKDYKIDHVVHGAIATAAVFGALTGATVEQIESAIGMLVAHYIPFRAIRAGHQLSDSKGASAAISAEMAVLSVRRSQAGFVGPADIFRNPQALFCLFEPPAQPESSPFDLTLATSGEDFAIMGMHFKLGLYEHQSAGAIQGLMDLLEQDPSFPVDPQQIHELRIQIYEPAFGIIGDPAKRDPRTRQSADHSMVYIVATLLRKAQESGQRRWEDLMLMPADYEPDALQHPVTRQFMQKIVFEHGGDQFDRRYPDGIPTQVDLVRRDGSELSSGLVMYPTGHARCENGQLPRLLATKIARLLENVVESPADFQQQLDNLGDKTADQVRQLYRFDLVSPLEVTE